MPHFAEIILPLALPKRTYTFSIPGDLVADVRPGVRVEVQFGKAKLYAGLVETVHQNQPDYKTKNIISLLDEVEVVSPQQLKLWDWMADYYCSTLGEVMLAALPGHLKLTSETSLVLNPLFDDAGDIHLENDEYLIAEALRIQKEISIEDARKILEKKSIFPVVQSLLNKGVLFVREELQEKYKPKKVSAVRLAEPYRSNETLLSEGFNLLEKNERQAEAMMAFLQLARNQAFVKKSEVLAAAKVSDSVLKSLEKKGLLEIYEREVSRISDYKNDLDVSPELTAQQQKALLEIRQIFLEKDTVLLHGVTGSGKTQVYVELIRETIAAGGQALYLLPEIALTTQIISRLQKIFGNDVSVYHSKINYDERVELWQSAAAGKPVLLGARSSIFLPFQNLKLIIVDEEHDPSFKQFDPAPRYNARDSAVFLANIYGAKTLLGTATPSVESWQNTLLKKYGLVSMPERFGGLQMPEIQTVNLTDAHKKRAMQSIFTTQLIEELQATLARGEQAILFQNRRGYSPILECEICSQSTNCKNCDVSLTYHKQSDSMRCHYCNYRIEVPKICPACGSGKMVLRGFGTEKIEDEIKIFLPTAKIGRLDFDTASTKTKLTDILNDFEERKIDILVGTQMVTKGLDFDNVAVVGVLGADSLVKFPDFRSGERAFQMLTQVAGRAGRKQKQGKVIIQAWNPSHPVLQEVFRADFQGFMSRELNERKLFHYPPFYRLVGLQVKHKNENTAKQAADFLAKWLRERLGNRVLGPSQPGISRVRGYFLQDILVKFEKSASVLANGKRLILQHVEHLKSQANFRQVVISVDVDPV